MEYRSDKAFVNTGTVEVGLCAVVEMASHQEQIQLHRLAMLAAPDGTL